MCRNLGPSSMYDLVTFPVIYIYIYSQVRKPTGWEVEWAECLLIEVLAWSSIAQWVCQQAFSLLANRCLRPWVRILHSAEEDNLSPFDSNIACLCQSMEINNNKYIYIYIYSLLSLAMALDSFRALIVLPGLQATGLDWLDGVFILRRSLDWFLGLCIEYIHAYTVFWAPSQYKDRLSQVWGFPC